MLIKVFLNKRFILIVSLVFFYIGAFIINDNIKVFESVDLESALFDGFSISYFYLPIFILIILDNISKYKNKIVLIRYKSNMYLEIIKNFNIFTSLIFILIFILTSFFNLSKSSHLIINIFFIANIYLMIFIIFNYFSENKLINLIPFIIYGFEVVLFQTIKKSFLLYYMLPLSFSIPIYILIAISLLILIIFLHKVSDVFA